MNPIDTFVNLRILVAALGEKSQACWWNSSFLGETGVRYLAFAFPRAPEIAAIQGAVEAARRVHDERIGAKSVTHLFRQSYEIELHLLDYLKEAGAYIKGQMATLYVKPGECKAALLKLARTAEFGHEGPIQIGTTKGLPDEATIMRMAAIYLGALEGGKAAFPYFQSPT